VVGDVIAGGAGISGIGARVRSARLTLQVLAGLYGVSAAYLSMVENGKRPVERYSLRMHLAAALRGVQPRYGGNRH
jgi:transcriptional regulator with XRE-family HTH domain